MNLPWLVLTTSIFEGNLELVGSERLIVSLDGFIAEAHQTAWHLDWVFLLKL
jgi:hypothetical protein